MTEPAEPAGADAVGAATVGASVSPRQPSLVAKACSALHWLLGWPAYLLLMVWYLRALSGTSPGLVMAGLVAIGPVYVAVVAVHEFGHWLVARALGLRPLQVRIARWTLQPRRVGVRMRVLPRGEGWDGYVVVHPKPGVTTEREWVALLLAGAGANLVAMLVCGVWAGASDGAFSVLLNLFALMNLQTAISALVPTAKPRPNDGLMAWQLMRGGRLSVPGDEFALLNARSVHGVTADQLPEHELAALGRQPAPMPLFHDWLRLKAAQNRGDWAAAVALAPQIERNEAAMPPAMRELLDGASMALRVELAFSAAMLSRCPQPLETLPRGKGELWELPHLPPRLQALKAALAGDVAGCERALERSRRMADNSVDLSLRRSEKRLRAAVRAVLPAQ
ncbi:M50 family metallopeptidase [Montanilutibacter psychrotolerans]|uniref:M50 family peptidase n=1 Tax=Montanilutibacter psychrotolerans TaxID=1327343 RepID=A0A3M8SV12_9GAMM|nr:M50 family metallopeptidase [Lysobacter psychrotolerans]RNF85171.1 M50 family peptidase [Lysobacter psychrotolerans]